MSTGQISQIENATLNPPFGDLLSPAATAPVAVTVQSEITKLVAKSLGGKALVTGSVAPGSGHVKGSLTVLARAAGSKRQFKTVATDRLATSDGNFAVIVPLAARSWQIEVKFQEPERGPGGDLADGEGRGRPGAGGERQLALAEGRQRVAEAGGHRQAGSLDGRRERRAAGAQHDRGQAGELPRDRNGEVGAGKTTFTLKARLARGARWVLQLEYLQKGGSPGYSKLRTIDVK